MEEISTLEEAVNYVGGNVNSVNGKTGDVILDAQDVGAATPSEVSSAKTEAIETSESYTDSQVASAVTPVSNKVNTLDTAINKTVLSNVTISADTSTDTLSLDSGKVNIKTGATSSATIPFPVASASEAGVMNSATFIGLQNTTDIANGLLNGAVAVSGLAAEPTQAQLTAAWKEETGRTELMNRAVLYDITNEKLWTYYTNTSTWYSAAAGGGSVDVQPWTNTQAGIVKGSTTDGQIFAENDGTGSVNGWDDIKTNIQNLEQAGYQTENDVNNTIAATNVVDLADGTDYVKNTDYATTSTGGTIKVSSAAATSVASNGVLQTEVKTFADYTTLNDKSFVGKGTLENVIDGKGLTGENFTGTDGTITGEAGLVPAPTTADIDKFLKGDGTWAEAGGGSSVNVVQTIGTSTTDVMSQDAATKMVFGNADNTRIQIGKQASATFGNRSIAIGSGYNSGEGATVGWDNCISIGASSKAGGTDGLGCIAIGNGAQANQYGKRSAVAIGSGSKCLQAWSVSLGASSEVTAQGEVSLGGSTLGTNGYNSTSYRLLTNVHDGQSAHDAATVGQLNALIDAINSATNTSIPHIGA